jgi:rhodanese-related sulfurtransferase
MNYPVSNEKVPLPTQTYAPPQPLGPNVPSAALAYFSQGAKSITAEELRKLVSDEDRSNDPLVIDIRRPEDYAQGHIPGAINILGPDIFTPATLAVLPTDRQIVVSCYTAQTASQVVAALNLLGYDAYTLEHAMCSWAVPQGVPNSCWDDKMSRNYPVSTEPVMSPLTSKRIYFGTNRASG